MSTMTILQDNLPDLAQSMNAAFSATEDRHGRFSAWVALPDKASLVPCCQRLKDIGARLSMITAMTGKAGESDIIAYHFDIAGSTVTIKVTVPAGGAVDTIVPVFRNADWHEREFMELYDIHVDGRTDNRRLFLDESVSGQVMERLIPLSVLSNAASTNMLFEHLLKDRDAQ